MKINEENYIIQLKKRNEKALEYVVDNYGWIIKTVVGKHLYNLPHVQEECINDIFLGIWNNIQYYDENLSEFKNWIAGIARFKSIDYKRKYLKESTNSSIEDLDIHAEDTINEILKEELSEEVEEMMSYLKIKDKELFYKLYIEEKDMDSITKDTGMKRDVIYNRVARGKRKLRSIFSLKDNGGVKYEK